MFKNFFFCIIIVSLMFSSGAFCQEEPLNNLQQKTLTFHEVWSRGFENDDLFFGAVIDVVGDTLGNIYLLDIQLNQVVVLDSSGNFVQTLGRTGEGPGEFRNPVGLVFLPGPRLGVITRIPGKIVQLDLSGTPMGTVKAGQNNSIGGGYSVLNGAGFRGQTLVFCGEESSGNKRNQFLAIVDINGQEKFRLLTKPRANIYATRQYNEKDQDFVSRGRWTLGPNGDVYAGIERNEYQIDVFSSDGAAKRTVKHNCSPRKRTPKDLESLGNSFVMMIDGQRVCLESELEEYDPYISDLRVTAANNLWVKTSMGAKEPPEGVFAQWDVFNDQGILQHKVNLVVPGNSQQDRLILLDEERAILLVGYHDALQASRPGSSKDQGTDQELEPLTVIGLRRSTD
ncbi:MAG: hypothetical protein GY780_07420 [bacterium]|nr:hypothetical protein [bacterium]